MRNFRHIASVWVVASVAASSVYAQSQGDEFLDNPSLEAVESEALEYTESTVMAHKGIIHGGIALLDIDQDGTDAEGVDGVDLDSVDVEVADQAEVVQESATPEGMENHEMDEGMHHGGADRSGMDLSTMIDFSGETVGTLKQGGQASFSAIIEIVQLLEADIETDWSTVSIDALRTHLRDMDNIMLATEASTTVIDENRIRFNVSGPGSSYSSIKAMVPTHAKYVQQARGWVITTDLTNNGATVDIAASSPDDIMKLKALGFYGFMSLESHHQVHHYMIAKGLEH